MSREEGRRRGPGLKAHGRVEVTRRVGWVRAGAVKWRARIRSEWPHSKKVGETVTFERECAANCQVRKAWLHYAIRTKDVP